MAKWKASRETDVVVVIVPIADKKRLREVGPHTRSRRRDDRRRLVVVRLGKTLAKQTLSFELLKQAYGDVLAHLWRIRLGGWEGFTSDPWPLQRRELRLVLFVGESERKLPAWVYNSKQNICDRLANLYSIVAQSYQSKQSENGPL